MFYTFYISISFTDKGIIFIFYKHTYFWFPEEVGRGLLNMLCYYYFHVVRVKPLTIGRVQYEKKF